MLKGKPTLTLFNEFNIISNLFIRKKLKDKLIQTNVDSLIGTKILITKEINFFNNGEGKIRDIYWTCVVETNETISVNEYALIVRVEGNKLIVKKQ